MAKEYKYEMLIRRSKELAKELDKLIEPFPEDEEIKYNFIAEELRIKNGESVKRLAQYIMDNDLSEFSLYATDKGIRKKGGEQLGIRKILSNIKLPNILLNGINNKKYKEILEELKLPNLLFQYIFVCENILRKFIIQELDDNGYPSIDSIGHRKLSETIKKQKNQETVQNYLPVRGDHDIYYLDLIDLNKVLQHEDTWNKCFHDKFKTQRFIIERIESLYSIRCRVAHSSGYLTSDELKSVETYCREIIKQIDQHIK